jgi:hypothetical protein
VGYCLSFCSFSFDHCVACPFWIYVLLFQIVSQNYYYPTFTKAQIQQKKLEDTKPEDINQKT